MDTGWTRKWGCDIANYLKENPFYLDSPVNIGPPEFGKIFVKEVRWSDFAPSDHLLITTATGGTLIDETVGAGDTELGVMRFGPFGWVNSFDVIDITGNVTVTITKS
jgi:hypothetical protein